MLSAAPLALAAGKPPQSGNYSGKTNNSDKGPVTFTYSAAKNEITHFKSQLGYNGACGQGGGPNYTFTVAVIKLTKSHTFSTTVQGMDNAAKAAIRITGSISGTSAHGVIATVKPSLCAPPNQSKSGYTEAFSATKH